MSPPRSPRPCVRAPLPAALPLAVCWSLLAAGAAAAGGGDGDVGFRPVTLPVPLEAGSVTNMRTGTRLLETGLAATFGRRTYDLPAGDPAAAPDPLAALAFRAVRAARADDLAAFRRLRPTPGRSSESDGAERALRRFRENLRLADDPDAEVRLTTAEEFGGDVLLRFAAPAPAGSGRVDSGKGGAEPGTGTLRVRADRRGGYEIAADGNVTVASGLVGHATREAGAGSVAPPPGAVAVALGADDPAMPVTLHLPIVKVSARSDRPGEIGGNPPEGVAGAVRFLLETLRLHRAGEWEAVVERLGPHGRYTVERAVRQASAAGRASPAAEAAAAGKTLDEQFLPRERDVEVVAATPGGAVTIVWARAVGGSAEWPASLRAPGMLTPYFVEQTDAGPRLAALFSLGRPRDALASAAVRAAVAGAAGLDVTPTGPAGAAAGRGVFVTPIGGEPWEDWAVTNYVDMDPKYRGVRDARGGPYTYDFHQGMDFTLPNFAAMDRGVPVLAAADGVVIEVQDGHPDRNFGDISNPKTRPRGKPNLVRIDHPGGLRTSYLHLKKGSLTVEPGDRVAAGQAIAEVGSSGMSSDPHLHFEVHAHEGANAIQIGRRGGVVVATLEDPERWWIKPLPYAGDVPGALDHGVTATEPDEEAIRDRPTDAGPFAPRGPAGGADRTVWVWARLHGFADGDRLEFEFRDPRGRAQYTARFKTDATKFGWWKTSLELPARVDPGRWTVRATRNGRPLFTETFTVGGGGGAGRR